MASPFSASAPYPLRLGVEPIREGVYTLTLDDDAGHSGTGVFTFSVERELGHGFPTWFEFLRRFAHRDPGKDALVLFGRDLFRAVVEELPRVNDAWQGIAGAAGSRPLALTLELGSHTEPLAALPFELLHDHGGFVFARPGAALRRAYAELTEKRFALPSEPRVLFAWANPPGAGDDFDPEPHAAALGRVFGPRLERLDQATREGVRERVRQAWVEGDPFHYVHILAHGFRDIAVAGVVLCGEHGGAELVDAQRLGQVLNNAGVQLAFLCSCQTAIGGDAAFSGVGQQLLSPRGGDLPAVVATQANLPVWRSAELGESFYRQLARCGDPGEALVAARREAYDVGGFGWSVPILLSRPAPTERVAPVTVAGLPARRATYLERPELEDAILAAVDQRRLVSVVGLPGIGKTEAGAEAARRAKNRGMFERAIHREARAGMSTGDLRRTLGAALGMTELPADDEGLAYAFAAQSGRLLLVIDNAEDLMHTEESQLAFRDQLDVLLAGAPRLHLLLTTRWPVGATQQSEFEIDVPPLPRKQMASLLEKELRAQGGYHEEWPSSPAWEELLDLLDGHPRTLWLAARQLAGQAASLERVVARLRDLKADAALDADLVGRKDVYEALANDKQARLRSLVAGMDLSFEVLAQRHPQAIEVFLALSLFPAGLPEVVAREVAGEEGCEGLDQLLRYHLAQWQASRVYYPVPLHWYAERRRRERPIEDSRYRSRALAGFVPFLQACDQALSQGAIRTGIESFMGELPTLQVLVAGVTAKSFEAAPLLEIAIAASNVLEFSHQRTFARVLFDAASSTANAGGDRINKAFCLLLQGQLEFREDHWAAAREKLAMALPILRESSQEPAVATSLSVLGAIALREEELSLARDYLTESATRFQRINYSQSEANCLIRLSEIETREDNHPEAQKYLAFALNIFQRNHDQHGEANCLKKIGDVQLQASDVEGANKSYRAALPIFQRNLDRLGEANCLRSLGELHLQKDDLARARKSFETAMPIFKEIHSDLDGARCLNSWGDLQVRENDLEAARTSYTSALTTFRNLGAHIDESNCLRSLGDLEHIQGTSLTARTNYEHAAMICYKIRHRRGASICLQRLAELELCEGRVREAFLAFINLLDLCKETSNGLGIQACFGNLARAARIIGRTDQALLLAEASLTIGRQIGNRIGQLLSLELQIQIWFEEQDILSALGAIQVYHTMGLSIGDVCHSERYMPFLSELLSHLGDETRQALEANPEEFRLAGVAAIQGRFSASGLDLLTPPD